MKFYLYLRTDKSREFTRWPGWFEHVSEAISFANSGLLMPYQELFVCDEAHDERCRIEKAPKLESTPARVPDKGPVGTVTHKCGAEPIQVAAQILAKTAQSFAKQPAKPVAKPEEDATYRIDMFPINSVTQQLSNIRYKRLGQAMMVALDWIREQPGGYARIVDNRHFFVWDTRSGDAITKKGPDERAPTVGQISALLKDTIDLIFGPPYLTKEQRERAFSLCAEEEDHLIAVREMINRMKDYGVRS